ncbi:hypothetical protein BC629DRAFT_1285080 [Irpex lacteus]|nr:hypothetical protein BC629DRAFT_1285080 [Irpex lacteus]
MHPFGGTPICPRCNKAVYAAEQIMGPGRKLYHKPCLSCASCKKRLDSYSLVEHDEEAICHVKNFGTRDLRHANLPDRDDVFISPPTSPTRAVPPPLPARSSPSAPALPPRKATGNGNGVFDGPRATSPTSPLFRPNRTYTSVRQPTTKPTTPPAVDDKPQSKDDEDWDPPVVNGSGVGTPSHTGRGVGGLPRTVPLGAAIRSPSAMSNGRTMHVPLAPASIGVRYGAALGGGGGNGRFGSPMTPMGTGRQWGGGTPVCPKCQKTVYFAEQVKAIGKTYHRGCLRCTGCNTSLDSSKLTEKDGDPYCKHCYGKRYGPAGSGYALLGKAGG